MWANPFACGTTLLSRVGIVRELPPADGVGKIVVATGGTSDMPVAEGCPHRRGFGQPGGPAFTMWG